MLFERRSVARGVCDGGDLSASCSATLLRSCLCLLGADLWMTVV